MVRVDEIVFDLIERSLKIFTILNCLRKYRSFAKSQMLESIIPQSRSNPMHRTSVHVQIWVWVVDINMWYWIITIVVKTASVPRTQKNVSWLVSGSNEYKPVTVFMGYPEQIWIKSLLLGVKFVFILLIFINLIECIIIVIQLPLNLKIVVGCTL